MCMIDDCEPWKFFAEWQRKARKEHTCGECRRTIYPGETYRYCKGMVDDGWNKVYVMKQCAHCDTVTGWLTVACKGYLFECVEEDLFEHITGYEEELRTAPLVRLGRWMRADWRDREGNLRPVNEVQAVTDHAIALYRRQYDKALARS